MGNDIRCCESDADPERTARHTEDNRLDQKLEKHIDVTRADCEPQPNLLRTFGDGYQHDVHDPDTADDTLLML